MSRLQRAKWRFWHLLVTVGVVSSAATAIVTVPGASATNRSYSCSSCRFVPGPNDYVRNNEAINYTWKEVAATLWTSGGAFVQEAYSNKYKALVCHKPGEFYGHGAAAERAGGQAHLAGREDNYATCG
jgi:hypothetical protein